MHLSATSHRFAPGLGSGVMESAMELEILLRVDGVATSTRECYAILNGSKVDRRKAIFSVVNGRS